jgi:hypothetical protein
MSVSAYITTLTLLLQVTTTNNFLHPKNNQVVFGVGIHNLAKLTVQHLEPDCLDLIPGYIMH